MLTESRDCSIEPSGLEPIDPSESDPRKIVVWVQLERSLIFRLRCSPVPVKGLVQEGEREMCDGKIRIDLQGVLHVLPGSCVASVIEIQPLVAWNMFADASFVSASA